MHATTAVPATIISDELMSAHRRDSIAGLRGQVTEHQSVFFRQSQLGSAKTVVKQGQFEDGKAKIAYWDYSDNTRDEYDGHQWFRGVAGKAICVGRH